MNQLKIISVSQPSQEQTGKLIELYQQGFCFREPFWELDASQPIREEIQRLTTDPQTKYYFAQKNSVAVGILVACSIDPIRFAQLANRQRLQTITETDTYLLELAVDESQRNQGIGRKLVQTAIDNARQAERAGVTLRVDWRNTPATTLYQKLGFTELTDTGSYNPFDSYIRLPFNSNQEPLISPPDSVSRLRQQFPPLEYFYFTTMQEISGWQQTTQRTDMPVQLYFDKTNWQFGSQNFIRQIWIAERSVKSKKKVNSH